MRTKAHKLASTDDPDEIWFGVRCHFFHPPRKSDKRPLFEERITLWEADSMDHAIERGEAEAVEYAGSMKVRYLEACSVYHVFSSGFGVDGREVFSEMRESDLEPDVYLNRFFFTGLENTQPNRSEGGS